MTGRSAALSCSICPQTDPQRDVLADILQMCPTKHLWDLCLRIDRISLCFVRKTPDNRSDAKLATLFRRVLDCVCVCAESKMANVEPPSQISSK